MLSGFGFADATRHDDNVEINAPMHLQTSWFADTRSNYRPIEGISQDARSTTKISGECSKYWSRGVKKKL